MDFTTSLEKPFRSRVCVNILIYLGITFVLSANTVLAQSIYTWTPIQSTNFKGGETATWNTTSNYWSDSNNNLTTWQDNTVSGRDIAVFQSGQPSKVTIGSNVSASKIEFKSGPFTFTNNPNYSLKIGAGGIDAGALTSETITFNTPIKLVNDQIWEVGANAVIQHDGTLSSSTAALTKTGAGMLTLTNANNQFYQGAIIVNGGTLQLDSAKTSISVTGKGNITINGDGSTVVSASNGILQLATNDQIYDSATITLAGGTFATNGHNETLGTLTLVGTSSTPHSIINFGGTSGVLTFADSSGSLGSGLLDIQGWNGLTNGGGNEQLIIGSSGSLSSAQLSQIQFINPNGAGGNYTAIQRSNGEIVAGSAISPTPEPGGLITLFIGLSITSAIVARRRNAPPQCA